MLQGLELADHLAELLAGLEVVEGQIAHRLHAAHRLGTLRGQCAALLIAQRGQSLAGFTEHTGGTDEDVIQVQFAGLAAVHGRVDTAIDSRRPRIEQEQTDAGFVAIVAGGTCRHEN
ncbi:hypothetical protein D9M71_615650 [compost metagenome]